MRGRSLPRELLGRTTFTQMIWLHLTGTDPTPGQLAVLDACLVALMEHGLTPTAVTARLTYGSAPEAMQGAVAAGLLSVGSLFAGTTEQAAAVLGEIARAKDPAAEARAVARRWRSDGRRLPGLGHPLHRPVDPRAVVLLRLAHEHGVAGAHCAALDLLVTAAEAESGRPLPANATGAIAAILADAGLPAEILRGIALISRCAGLVGHIREEQERPAMLDLWHAAEGAVPYAPEPEEEP